jgi:hypothetical protein
MISNKISVAALILAAALQATPAACQEEAVSVGQLAEHPDQFDGKHVKVRGYVVITPHSRNIFESKQGYDDPHGACLGLLGSKAFVKVMRKREEVVSGIFRKALCRPNDVCLYWCSASGIELDN